MGFKKYSPVLCVLIIALFGAQYCSEANESTGSSYTRADSRYAPAKPAGPSTNCNTVHTQPEEITTLAGLRGSPLGLAKENERLNDWEEKQRRKRQDESA